MENNIPVQIKLLYLNNFFFQTNEDLNTNLK